VLAPRTKALSTRLLVLLELHNHRHSKLKSLAERLDVTVQAVSDYLKRLSNEGLVEHVGGAWRPTKRGTAVLHETVIDLRRFVDDSMKHLRIIDETFALAERRVHAEQEVGLTMKDGRLHAGPARPGASRGVARTEADAGQLLLVGDLNGLLDLHPAPIQLLGHPDFPEGAALEHARRETKRATESRERVLIAAHALTSLAWVWALGLEVDLEFASLAAAQEAAERGVPVLYFVPEDERAACEARIAASTADRSEPVPVRSVRL
jgi:predicted transcriptional regulator